MMSKESEKMKPKGRQKVPPAELEKIRTAEEVRKMIEDKTAIRGVNKREIAEKMLERYDMEVTKYISCPAISQLIGIEEEVDPKHFKVLLIMAIENTPDFEGQVLEAQDPETLKMILQYLKEEGLPEISKEIDFYEDILWLAKLEKSELETIDEIFDNEELVLIAMRYLESCKESVNDSHLQEAYMVDMERDFLQRAIEEQPRLIYEYYKEFLYAVITNPETLEIVMKLFKEKGYKVSPEMFKEPTEANQS